MKHMHDEFSSLGEVNQSIDTTKKRKGWRRVLAFFGPAYLVSVGYMDPGNWATDLAGGSKFGYQLIWVLLMSNLMALLLQSLSARLGIVRGRDLAQANRETYPRPVNFAFYLLAEVAIAATDLAEILGMAIGIQLLTGLPLIWGVSLTVADTFLFLLLQRLGMRTMEAFIICLVGIIGLSFLAEMLIAKPDMGEVVKGFIPSIPNEEALYIAIGIIGATVMPHNLYLHSALVQTRKIKRDEAGIKRVLKLNLAHELLAPMLGSNLAPILFAVALIASGQSSTITGTLAGQIVMEGYLHLRITPWVRRLLTRLVAIVPAIVVILINGENNIDKLLVFSQVVLSLQLGFAIIPLIHFTSDKKTMGSFAIKPLIIVLATLITLVLVYLNIRMVYEQTITFFATSDSVFWKSMIIIAGVVYISLLLIAIFYPLMGKTANESVKLHPEAEKLHNIIIPSYDRVAVALDFSKNDHKLIAHALGQGGKESTYLMIHVVESPATRVIGEDADDMETRKDQQRMEGYVNELKEQGYNAVGLLGFDGRVKEIVRLVKDRHADILIIGAHGHTGLKDVVYGETVEAVRHELKIPVLVVNV